jgi:hypothetical protein
MVPTASRFGKRENMSLCSITANDVSRQDKMEIPFRRAKPD